MKKLNKIIILALTLAGLYSTKASAQQNPRPMRPGMEQGAGRPNDDRMANSAQRMEKLESAKIAFLTQKMDLNPKEAEKFWPVYNQFQNEVRELNKQRKENMQSQSQLSANDRLDNQLDMETRMLDLKKKYSREFGKVISAEKVVRLFEAEREFRQELLKQLQQRRENKQ